MKQNKIAKWLPLIMGLILLLYTAFRTIDLFQQQLPANQQILAIVAVGAFDFALMAWAWYYADGAVSAGQRAIALMMFIISVIAVTISTLGDSVLTAGQNGLVSKLDEGTMMMVVIATVLIVMMNVACTFIVHFMDPDRQAAAVKQEFEQAITDEAHKAARSQLKTRAAQLAPLVAQQMMEELESQVRSGMLTGTAMGRGSGVSIPSNGGTFGVRRGSPSDTFAKQLSRLDPRTRASVARQLADNDTTGTAGEVGIDDTGEGGTGSLDATQMASILAKMNPADRANFLRSFYDAVGEAPPDMDVIRPLGTEARTAARGPQNQR